MGERREQFKGQREPALAHATESILRVLGLQSVSHQRIFPSLNQSLTSVRTKSLGRKSHCIFYPFKEQQCFCALEYKFWQLLREMFCIHLAHFVNERTEAE